ncbi:MAG TPA: chromosomal replication initiator protein DnaA, partial [Tepidisphaeraceae bacterium]|nr:chromosomal replication initiator protein DnaA [Tepidisphaeraceae bacterium]
MTTTQSPPRDGLVARRAQESAAPHGPAHAAFDPTVWQRILQNVRLQHPTLNRVWFDQLQPKQLTNGVIQVTVTTPAQLNFCQSQCQQPFTAAAQTVTGRLVAVSFHCDNLPRGGVFNEAEHQFPLNPDYVFENFVTGPCNRLPHAASLAVSEQPGKAYNPLFIHGGVGLGKSHLLQAVCQKVMERTPDARILYLSCDSFINQFISAVETGDMNSFRHRYRHVDVLVIDDIHFLAGRDRTQEEFFHTFNTLYQTHKQIILSADAAPSEIPELEERLVSRFNWGLVARIEKPCYETRVAILKKKARMRGLELADDVICYIAAKVENNTRELEGAITKIQGMAMIQEGKIDLDVARAALGDTAAPEQARITIQ